MFPTPPDTATLEKVMNFGNVNDTISVFTRRKLSVLSN